MDPHVSSNGACAWGNRLRVVPFCLTGDLAHSEYLFDAAMMSTPACLSFLVLCVHGAEVTKARIVDATGRPSSSGLLQVKTEFGFGSVWSAVGRGIDP